MKRLLGSLFAVFFAMAAEAAAPAAPDFVKVAWIENLNHFLIRWAPVADATNYNVYRYDTNSSTWAQIATNLTVFKVPMFRDPAVPNPGPVTYAVAAVNLDGESPRTTASLSPELGHGPSYTYDWDPPVGYTFGQPSFSGSYLGGTDGMIELGLDWQVWTNVLDVSWRTNLDYGYRAMFTNLTAGTVYYWRLTAVEENGNGITLVSPNFRFVTLPAPVFDVYEEQPTGIQLGHWGIQNLQYLTSPAHGVLETGTWWGDVYTGHTNFVGTDTFQILDNTNGPPVTVTINVLNVNDAPVAEPFTVYAAEDSEVLITPYVTDIENDPYSVGLGSWDGPGGFTVQDQTNLVFYLFTNFVGTLQFIYLAYDQYGGWSPYAQGTIIVTNINDAPEASDVSVTAHTGATYTGYLSASDVEADPLQAEIVTAPTAGTVTVNGTNFFYTPGPGEFYNDSFTYRVTDGQAISSVATVNIFVAGPNTLPQAYDQAVSALERYEESSWTLDAVDADGDPLQAILVSPPTNGTVTFNGMMAVYRREVSNLSPDSFSYRPWDGSGTGNVATVTISVVPNRPPVAHPQSFTRDEDSFWLFFYLSASDADGDPLTFELLTLPNHGTVFGNSSSHPGYVSYRPATNYFGSDSFTFRVHDGVAYSSSATVSLTITPLNDAPVRVTPNSTFSLMEDGFQNFDVLATDVDGDALTYQIVTPPTNGTITFRSTTGWTYTPNTNSYGADSVSWVATDGQAQCSVGTITFTVASVNDSALAVSQTVTVTEDIATPITLQGISLENLPLTYSIGNLPLGILEGSGSDRLYRPPTNFFGQTTFTFRVSDSVSTSDWATVTINVTNVNDPVTAIDQNQTMAEDGIRGFSLAGSDPDGDSLTYELLTNPAHGTLIFNPALPNLIYRPAQNYHGTDSFTFRVSDGEFTSSPATVTFTIVDIPDPVANPQSVTTTEDTTINITVSGSDPFGRPLTFIHASLPEHGQLTGLAPNYTYRPYTNFNGTDSFSFTVWADGSQSDPATVSITVTPVNDAPVAADQSLSLPEDTSAPVTLSGTDVDGDALTFAVVSGPQHGEYVDGVYTPDANYYGPDSLTFTANDSTLDSALATVSITVTAVNDAPVAHSKTFATTEDQSSGTVVLTGSDVEGSPLHFTVIDGPAHGTYANSVYTPAANYYGPDSFTYRANDGQLDSAPATVSITVVAANDAPVADSKSVSVTEDGSVAIALTGSDVEGSTLTFAVVYGPLHGTFANGIYTPNANYFGTDSIQYRANDGQVDSFAAAVVSITVNPMNDAPVANNQTIATPYNTPVNIVLTGSDVEGNALTYTTLTSPSNGTLTGTGANRTFTPNIGWYGATSFTFKVNDGALDSATAPVTIIVGNPGSVPAAPSVLTATAISRTQINLAWNDNSNNEDGFKIERSPNGSSGWTQIATVGRNVKTFSNTGLSKNTRYYYRVRAHNVLGNSAYSNTANARTFN